MQKRKRLMICLIVLVISLILEGFVIAAVNGWLPGSSKVKRGGKDVDTGNVSSAEGDRTLEGATEEGVPSGEGAPSGNSASSEKGVSSGEDVPSGNGDSSGEGAPSGNGDSSGENGYSEGNGSSGESEVNSGGTEKAGSESDPEAGQTKLKFRMGSLEAGGLPEEVLDQIARINTGKLLEDVVALDNLEGYFALTGTTTIIAEDTETGEMATGVGTLSLGVPNLLEGLEDISVLFYDNAAGTWSLIPADKTNTKAKTVSVTLTGSGTLVVVYRRQTEKTD